MGELVRRMDYERRSKDLIRQNAKSRFLTKEYSRPVQSANDLAKRKRQKVLQCIKKDIKSYGAKYAHEKENVETFKRRLSVTSIDFNVQQFQPSKARRSSSANTTRRVSNARDIVTNLPSNSVLEFGPGNTIIVLKDGRRTVNHNTAKTSRPLQDNRAISRPQTSFHSRKKSTTSTPFYTGQNQEQEKRPLTASPRHAQGLLTLRSQQSNCFPTSSRSEANYRNSQFLNLNIGMSDRGPSHSNSKLSEALPRSTEGRHTSFNLRNTSGSYSDSEDDESDKGDDDEDSDSNNKLHNNFLSTLVSCVQTLKSFRSLKKEHTYEEDELPDIKRDTLKKLKYMENKHFKNIQERVRTYVEKYKKCNENMVTRRSQSVPP